METTQTTKVPYIGKHTEPYAHAFRKSALLRRAKNVYKAICMSSPSTYQFLWFGDIIGQKDCPLFGRTFHLKDGEEIPNIIKRHIPDNFEFPQRAIEVRFYNKKIIKIIK